MSATTQPQTYLDLYTDLIQRVRQSTAASATVEQAKRYINTALLDMHIGFGEKFPWAERQAVIVTHPVYNDGTLFVEQGTNSFTPTGAPDWASNNVYGQRNIREGGKIRIAGSHEVYRVINTSVNIGIDTVYLGEDDTTATYTYWEDTYDLAADFLRPMDLRRFSTGYLPIELLSRTEFRARFEDQYNPGAPRHATIIDEKLLSSAEAARRVRLYPVPSQAYQIKYAYVTANLAVTAANVGATQLENDTDEPIVPLRYRHAIVLHALYNWYRDKKDDTRSAEVRAEYEALLARIAGDNEIGSPKPKIVPRVAPYARRARRPWSRGLSRFDVNDRFDRLEDL